MDPEYRFRVLENRTSGRGCQGARAHEYLVHEVDQDFKDFLFLSNTSRQFSYPEESTSKCLEEIIENFMFLEIIFIKVLVLIFIYKNVINLERQNFVN